jgi:uncharacterized membrane protein
MKPLLTSGRWVFAFAILALAAETIVCAPVSMPSLGPGSHCIPALPFIPAVPWLAILFGLIWIACAIGLLTRRWLRLSAYTIGVTYIAWTLVHVLPASIASPGDMGLRTVVLEPLSIACIALLLPAIPQWLSRACHIVVAVAMVVFGVDHFLALAGIGSLLPDWIPFHIFWIAFFGAVFILCGLGIGLGILERWSWIALGLMFALWVFTLHMPRTFGFYSVPGATTDPDEWSSLFIAIALWGGPLAVARTIDPAQKIGINSKLSS